MDMEKRHTYGDLPITLPRIPGNIGCTKRSEESPEDISRKSWALRGDLTHASQSVHGNHPSVCVPTNITHYLFNNSPSPLATRLFGAQKVAILWNVEGERLTCRVDRGIITLLTSRTSETRLLLMQL